MAIGLESEALSGKILFFEVDRMQKKERHN